MKVHTIKEWEPQFSDVLSGKKTFEILPKELNVQEGDLLMICQFANRDFTGVDVQKKARCVQEGHEGLKDGYVVVGLEDCAQTVDSFQVAMKVLREGYDFLGKTMFGDCPHCGTHITRAQSPEVCSECGGPLQWSENKFSAL